MRRGGQSQPSPAQPVLRRCCHEGPCGRRQHEGHLDLRNPGLSRAGLLRGRAGQSLGALARRRQRCGVRLWRCGGAQREAVSFPAAAWCRAAVCWVFPDGARPALPPCSCSQWAARWVAGACPRISARPCLWSLGPSLPGPHTISTRCPGLLLCGVHSPAGAPCPGDITCPPPAPLYLPRTLSPSGPRRPERRRSLRPSPVALPAPVPAQRPPYAQVPVRVREQKSSPLPATSESRSSHSGPGRPPLPGVSPVLRAGLAHSAAVGCGRVTCAPLPVCPRDSQLLESWVLSFVFLLCSRSARGTWVGPHWQGTPGLKVEMAHACLLYLCASSLLTPPASAPVAGPPLPATESPRKPEAPVARREHGLGAPELVVRAVWPWEWRSGPSRTRCPHAPQWFPSLWLQVDAFC